jgi:hypothetical protein
VPRVLAHPPKYMMPVEFLVVWSIVAQAIDHTVYGPTSFASRGRGPIRKASPTRHSTNSASPSTSSPRPGSTGKDVVVAGPSPARHPVRGGPAVKADQLDEDILRFAEPSTVKDVADRVGARRLDRASRWAVPPMQQCALVSSASTCPR